MEKSRSWIFSLPLYNISRGKQERRLLCGFWMWGLTKPRQGEGGREGEMERGREDGDFESYLTPGEWRERERERERERTHLCCSLLPSFFFMWKHHTPLCYVVQPSLPLPLFLSLFLLLSPLFKRCRQVCRKERKWTRKKETNTEPISHKYQNRTDSQNTKMKLILGAKTNTENVELCATPAYERGEKTHFFCGKS